ncbi:hypothetical protein ACI2JA_17070 [Alkalihalobacillus sp. NPDC078783]
MLYVIYGIVVVTIFTLLQVVLTYFGLFGNILLTLGASFIICTPITLLYLIWLELVELKELKEEEIREKQRLLKKERLERGS